MLGLIRKFAQWPWPLLRRTEEEVSDTWVQFRFQDNEAINEVTEVPALMYGTAAVTEEKLVTNPPSTSNYMAAPNVIFEANEDFSISLNVNMPFTETRPYNCIVGVYDSFSSGKYAWVLGRRGSESPSKKLAFNFNDNGNLRVLNGISDIKPNLDYHVEISRVSNVVYMFVNGNLESSMVISGGNPKIALPRLRTDVVHSEGQTTTSTHVGGGYKWSIQIKKGQGGHTENFTPSELDPYVRATYSKSLADKVAAQYGFRRNSLADEAGNGTGVLYGTASVSEGRIKQTAVTTSYFQLPIRKFGQGDFTIELMAKVSSVNSSYGAAILGHWKAGTAASDENRWCIHISAQGQISWNQARSANADDRHYFISPDGKFKFNTDQHIVVEKIGQTVSIYVDGELAASQDGFDFPIRGEAPHYARSLSSQNAYTMAGEVWNIRIVDQAVYKGQVKTKPTFPAFPKEDVWPWLQMTKAGQYNYDEVTGYEWYSTSNATVQNGTITTATSTTSRAETATVTFEENEDFTIEAKWKATAIHTNGGAILCVWNTAGQGDNSWCLILNPNLTLSFGFSSDGTTYNTLNGTIATKFGQEHHVAVVRKNGIIRMFVDGQPESATIVSALASFRSTRPLSTTWNASNYLNADRWDVRIVKGEAKYDNAFTPIALEPFRRPTYDGNIEPTIMSQYVFRENINHNEVTGEAANLSGTAALVRGRIKTTNANTSQYSLPTKYFGAADFTIEFMFKLFGSRSATMQILGQAYAGNQVHQDNSWNIYYKDNALLVAFWPGLTLTNNILNCGPLPLNVDSHIVVERVAGVITVYVNGKSVGTLNLDTTLVVPVTHTMTSNNKIPGANNLFGEREIWNIRTASRALYRGNVKPKSTFPRIDKSFSIQANTVSVQSLESIAANKELTDHNVQTANVQLLESITANKELTDHSINTVVIQALVKI